jgi:hypothetical protein
MAGGDAIISWRIAEALELCHELWQVHHAGYNAQTEDESTNHGNIRIKLRDFRIKLRIKLRDKRFDSF